MKYKNPVGFRDGITRRIREEANTKGVPAARRQMRFLFERFWLRLQRAFPVVVVKGGAALEFRLDRARTTRDLDLSVSRVPGDELLERLQAACREDFGDFLTFQVVEDSTLEAEGQRYEGRRLSVTCLLNNQPLFSKFGLDIAVGEPSGRSETFTIATSPTAAELGTLQIPLYCLRTHLAEKLHAYTLPRQYENSRVKDLPDMGLIAGYRDVRAGELRDSLRQTFSTRNTHDLPATVPEPPDSWVAPYRAMAKENRLPWQELDELHQAVAEFLNPLLGNELSDAATWDADNWSWIPPAPAVEDPEPE